MVGFSQYFLEKSHSSILGCLIDEVIRNSGIEVKDLAAVAISEGPGSYTGLRIGTSSTKGLCFGLDIPLIGVNTLLSMASGAIGVNINDALLCPMLDARRMEVYCIVTNNQLEIIEETKPVIVDENSFIEYFEKGRVLFFGDGSEKCKSALNHPNALFLDDIHPSAKDVGVLAWEKFKNEDFVDLTYFEPFYLKAFKAGKPKTLV